jgi:hypothetical protein
MVVDNRHLLRIGPLDAGRERAHRNYRRYLITGIIGHNNDWTSAFLNMLSIVVRTIPPPYLASTNIHCSHHLLVKREVTLTVHQYIGEIIKRVNFSTPFRVELKKFFIRCVQPKRDIVS